MDEIDRMNKEDIIHQNTKSFIILD